MSFIVSRFNDFHITSPLQLSLQIQLRSYKTQLIVIALKRREWNEKSIFPSIMFDLSACIDDLLRMTIQQSLPSMDEEENVRPRCLSVNIYWANKEKEKHEKLRIKNFVFSWRKSTTLTASGRRKSLSFQFHDRELFSWKDFPFRTSKEDLSSLIQRNRAGKSNFSSR